MYIKFELPIQKQLALLFQQTLLTKSFHGDKDIAKTNLKHFFNSVL